MVSSTWPSHDIKRRFLELPLGGKDIFGDRFDNHLQTEVKRHKDLKKANCWMPASSLGGGGRSSGSFWHQTFYSNHLQDFSCHPSFTQPTEAAPAIAVASRNLKSAHPPMPRGRGGRQTIPAQQELGESSTGFVVMSVISNGYR